VAYHGPVADRPDTSGEIDLRDYANRVVARWWIVAICIVGAIAAALLLTGQEDKKLSRATAVVFLGQPVSPNGAPVVNALTANTLFATTLARQSAVQQEAAQAAGLEPDALRGHVAVEPISAATRASGATVPLVNVIVQGPFTAAQSATAANAIADRIVADANVYAIAKTEDAVAARDRVRARLDELATSAAETRERLDAVDGDAALSPAERSALTTPLLAMLQYDANTEALLAEQLPDLEARVDYIETVEAARVLTVAKGAKVAPQSQRLSLLAAIILGLVVGILAAILSTAVRPITPQVEDAPPGAPPA
jgi:hypothetical protein